MRNANTLLETGKKAGGRVGSRAEKVDPQPGKEG